MWIGKAATGLFAFAVLGKLINHRWPTPEVGVAAGALLYAAVAVTFAALAAYMRNLRRVMRNPDTTRR
jgi:drug/metabolite transporter (DMT)-like permease